MLKKLIKGWLAFSLIAGVLLALMGGGGDSDKAPASKKSADTSVSESKAGSNIVAANEAIPLLFSELSSEQNNPVGDIPDPISLMERVRDSDGDLKTEDGFKIRATNSDETRTINDLVFVGTTHGGLKLYVPSDSNYIKIYEPSFSNDPSEMSEYMSLVVLCPELNQGMDWKVKHGVDMETLSELCEVTVNAEGESLTFTTKPGDKVYEMLSTVIFVTDQGKEMAELQRNVENIAKQSR
ncbi:hypothetical protein IKH79_00515 [Candidatus Saccharibacteria bacterium]|nr:hypothetical protein [Candidatus Saccharibacteria bacterium]